VGDCPHDHGRFVAVVSAMIFFVHLLGEHAAADAIQHIEVFTSTEQAIVQMEEQDSGDQLSNVDVRTYAIDGMKMLEDMLSFNLPTDPQRSKQLALKRLNEIDEATKSEARSAAIGLTKAMQYGIDRYPAIVFNSEGVVYGVTDMTVALEYYQALLSRKRP